MVRLKGTKATMLFCRLHISIPYGAIKSQKDFSQLRNISISIPYGAIKRVIRFWESSWKAIISIPYGAIKRTITKAC